MMRALTAEEADALELRRRNALAGLDLYERALRNLTLIVGELRQSLGEHGITWASWQALNIGERQELLKQLRRRGWRSPWDAS